MFQKTRAIVLHATKYSDNAMIVHAFTEEFGRISYVVNGRKSKKATFRSALLQPLCLVDLTVEHQPKNEIQRIKESKLSVLCAAIPSDPLKSALAFFVSELLYRTVNEAHQDKPLFDFLQQSILILDLTEESIANFHLIFLTKLSRFLGFYPNVSEENNFTCFDLLNGVFCPEPPPHNHFLTHEDASLLHRLLQLDYGNMQQLGLNRVERMRMLENMVTYYRLHLQEKFTLKSVEVLKTLFD